MSDQYPSNPYGQQQPAPTGPGGEPPLWAPYYGISFPKAVARFFKKYATFSGRASRSEFWWWYLANSIVAIVLGALYLVGALTSERETVSTAYSTSSVITSPSPLFVIAGILLGLWGLATIVPSLALGWRRLHDANLAGPLWIIAVFIGIVQIVFGLLPSNPQGARFDRPEGAR